MKKSIFLILGPQFSGKSTLLNIIKEKFEKENNLNYEFLSNYVTCNNFWKGFYHQKKGYTLVDFSEFNNKKTEMIWWYEDNQTPEKEEELSTSCISIGLAKADLLSETPILVANISTNEEIIKKIELYFEKNKISRVIRVILVDSPKEQLEKRLKICPFYQHEEISKVVEQGKFIIRNFNFKYTEYVENENLEYSLFKFEKILRNNESTQEKIEKYSILKKETEKFLKTNNVSNLFNYLLSKLLLHKPENPVEFLIKLLGNMTEKVLTKADLETLFDSIDILSMGYISRKRFCFLLKDLGMEDKQISVLKKELEEEIKKEVFVEKVNELLMC